MIRPPAMRIAQTLKVQPQSCSHLGLVVDGLDGLDEHTAALPEDGVFGPMHVGFKHPVLLKVYHLRSVSNV